MVYDNYFRQERGDGVPRNTPSHALLVLILVCWEKPGAIGKSRELPEYEFVHTILSGYIFKKYWNGALLDLPTELNNEHYNSTYKLQKYVNIMLFGAGNRLSFWYLLYEISLKKCNKNNEMYIAIVIQGWVYEYWFGSVTCFLILAFSTLSFLDSLHLGKRYFSQRCEENDDCRKILLRLKYEKIFCSARTLFINLITVLKLSFLLQGLLALLEKGRVKDYSVRLNFYISYEKCEGYYSFRQGSSHFLSIFAYCSLWTFDKKPWSW